MVVIARQGAIDAVQYNTSDASISSVFPCSSLEGEKGNEEKEKGEIYGVSIDGNKLGIGMVRIFLVFR